MKQLARTLLLTCTVLALAYGCSGTGFSTMSREDARKQYSSNNEVLGFLNIADEAEQFCKTEYGIATKPDILRFLSGSGEALFWKLTSVKPMSLEPVTTLVFSKKEAALAKKTALEQEGKEVFITPYNPLAVNGKPAPLMETWVSWPYERKVERVMQVLMYQFVSKTLKRKDSEPLARFLAEKATEEFLRKKLNPASPILARYISEQRDARTFAVLFPDFTERVRNVYQNKDPSLTPEAIQKTRTMLLTAWLADYRLKYADRFLTNNYVQFGNPIPNDAEIAAWEDDFAQWKTYNTAFMKANETLAAYLATLK